MDHSSGWRHGLHLNSLAARIIPVRCSWDIRLLGLAGTLAGACLAVGPVDAEEVHSSRTLMVPHLIGGQRLDLVVRLAKADEHRPWDSLCMAPEPVRSTHVLKWRLGSLTMTVEIVPP